MEHPGQRTLYAEIAGIEHKNPDGMGRRSVLVKCQLGEKLQLLHTPIPPDKNAVKIFRETGEQLGWLNRKLAAEIAPMIDAGVSLDATVAGEYKIKITSDYSEYQGLLEEKRYLRKAAAVQAYTESLDTMKKVERSYIKWQIKVGIVCGAVIAVSLGFLSCGIPFIGD